MNTITSSVLGAALLVSAAAAHADISSSADLGPLQISVIDLTPSDGLAAGFTLDPAAGSSNAYGTLRRDAVQLLHESPVSGWLAPTSVDLSMAGQALSASVASVLHAQGHTVAVANSSFDTTALSSTNDLVLAPHTQLQLSMPYSVLTDFGGFVPAAGDEGYALAQVSLFGMLATGKMTEDLVSFSFPTRDPYPDHSFQQGVLSISLVNDGDAPLVAGLVVAATISGIVVGPGGLPLPVPEPSSLALLGVGLACLAGRRRHLQRGRTAMPSRIATGG